MEANGIRVDVPYLDKMLDLTLERIRTLRNKLESDPLFKIWKGLYGEKTKLTAKEQLAEVLIKEGLYRPTHFTEKSKRPKSDKESLKKVNHPFVKDYQEMLAVMDDRTKYLKGIKREVVDGYLHPFQNLHTANTYRSSSSNPNGHNFPKRDSGRAELVRRCFIPRSGCYYGEVDFSGAEVRCAASYSKDPVLINYVKDSATDMHRDTAMQLFSLESSQVDKRTTRDWAKNRFVFAEFYGSVYFQCAEHIWEVVEEGFKLPGGVTVKEHLASKGITSLGQCDPKAIKREGGTRKGTFVHRVREVEEDFWNRRFSVYKKWKDNLWKKYQEEGGYQTKTGFYVTFGKEGVMTRNDTLSYGIQGSSFHCLLWFLIEIQKWLKAKRMKTLLVNQIHDSANFDIPPEEIQDVLNKAKELITHDLPRAWKWIIVPMEADTEVAPIDKPWFEIEKWECSNGIWGPKG